MIMYSEGIPNMLCQLQFATRNDRYSPIEIYSTRMIHIENGKGPPGLCHYMFERTYRISSINVLLVVN